MNAEMRGISRLDLRFALKLNDIALSEFEP